jgi:hypothetical protein
MNATQYRQETKTGVRTSQPVHYKALQIAMQPTIYYGMVEAAFAF